MQGHAGYCGVNRMHGDSDMGDDDALVRAIVENSREETPRLDYIDWLTRQTDPRASYARAELDRVTRRRGGESTDNVPSLRDLATGLDPVWVARISRPPFGVCCDHVRFIDRGPHLNATELTEAETTLGHALPIAYRAFMLNYNGGRPVSDRPGAGMDVVGDPIEYFDHLHVVIAPNTHPERIWMRDLPDHPKLMGCVPIGSANIDLDAIYLGCEGKRLGRVYIRYLSQGRDTDPELVERVAASMESLLSRLRVQPI